MENAVLYGAGKICRKYIHLISNEYNVLAIIDGSKSVIGKDVYGIPIISLENYLNNYPKCKIIITTNSNNIAEIEKVLSDAKQRNFSAYHEIIDLQSIDKRDRIISYSMPDQLEDVILYNVLREEDDIFYIDVGSNDPLIDSVTKLFYDVKGAHGINIEPQQKLIEITKRERQRDVNICMGIGEKQGTIDFYIQGGTLGGISTAIKENIIGDSNVEKISITVSTLKNICDKYLAPNQHITFLKIDVEGYEKNVLLGADFEKYRPMIIVIESTLPTTNIPCYDEWESILLDNRYHYVFSYGVNRYYVANEFNFLDEKFIPVIDIMKNLKVFSICQ